MTNIRGLQNCLTNVAQILDVAKQEWSAESVWTDWDQSVRDHITTILTTLNDGGYHMVHSSWKEPLSEIVELSRNAGRGADEALDAIRDVASTLLLKLS